MAWFCRGETRASVESSAADLRKDVRDMRKKRCGRGHILAVRFWITTTAIVPIVWDGLARVAKKLPLLVTVASKESESTMLSNVDPRVGLRSHRFENTLGGLDR